MGGRPGRGGGGGGGGWVDRRMDACMHVHM